MEPLDEYISKSVMSYQWFFFQSAEHCQSLACTKLYHLLIGTALKNLLCIIL